MSQVKLPIIQDTKWKQLTISDYSYTRIDSYMINGLLIKEPNGEAIVQKRRGYGLLNSASGYSSGKSIFTWEYYNLGVQNVTLWVAYQTSAAKYVIGQGLSSLSTIVQIPQGVDDGVIKWCQTSEPYAIVNPGGTENCWYVEDYALGVYTATRLSHATHGFTSQPLAMGIVELDSYVFVATTQGVIFNSNVGDSLTWTSTDFISAERVIDTTQYIAKQLEHVVVIGTSSIEVFYNAGNPAGSPLARREDVFYSTGCPDYDMIDNNDQYIAFVGSKRGQKFGSETVFDGIYLMENLQLKKISTDEMDYAITSSVVLRMGSYQGRPFVFVNGLDANYTLVYDIEYSVWYPWKSDYFVSAGLSASTAIDMESYHESLCMYTGGQIMQITNQVVDGATLGTNDPIELTIITEDLDLGTYKDKFVRKLALYGDDVSGGTVAVSYSDDGGTTWSTARNILMDSWYPLHRLGTTKKRRFKFVNDDEDIITLRACYTDVDVSSASYSEA